jgi:hypothetical protein
MREQINLHLDSLVHRFAQLGSSVRIGRGPEHPAEPDDKLAQQTVRWLNAHAFLQRDQGYVTFLKRYSGLEADEKKAGFGIAISGFSGFGGFLHELGPGKFDDQNPCVTPEGFYPFANTGGRVDAGPFRGSVLIAFSFDATERRKWGIYREIWPRNGTKVEYHWYCETFLEWLENSIRLKGMLIETGEL